VLRSPIAAQLPAADREVKSLDLSGLGLRVPRPDRSGVKIETSLSSFRSAKPRGCLDQHLGQDHSIVSQIKIRRGSALRLPWATARDRPYHETSIALIVSPVKLA